MKPNLQRFLNKTKKLLDLEKEADVLNKKSIKVKCLTYSTGLKGAYDVVVKAVKRLPSNDWAKVGQTVDLWIDGQNNKLYGVVSKSVGCVYEDISEEQKKENRIFQITFKEFHEDYLDSKSCRLALAPDLYTHKCLQQTMEHLEKHSLFPHAVNIVRTAFDNDFHPRFMENTTELNYFNDNLNESQKEAVEFGLLQSQDLCLVLGPPGTGKTTTIVEIIQQAVHTQNLQVLVCAPSNIAIDNIVEKLAKTGKKSKMVRVGHSARVLDSIVHHSMDYLLTHGENRQVVATIRKEMNDIYKKLPKTKRKRPLYQELKLLRKDLRVHEKKTISEIIQSSQIVLCTLTGANHQYVKGKQYDLVVIDEACQAIEIATWRALLLGKRALLAGDPFQLPPTVLDKEAERKGLSISLFERLYKEYKEKISKMLLVQYRMNEQIMQWSSDEFYKGKLVADESVEYHLLCDQDHVEEVDQTLVPLFLIDTSNCDMNEEQDEETLSRFNRHEVDLVVKHVRNLLNAGIEEKKIGILSPYSSQVQLIKEAMSENNWDCFVNTVDGFQGREKDVIIISMVRSNPKGEVGFLADERRTNVAITRARMHCCLIGDCVTLRTNPFLHRMAKYFLGNADVRNAFEYE